MQHHIGQAGQPTQAVSLIKVGNQRECSLSAPKGRLRRVAHQGDDPVTAQQKRKGSAGDVATPDNEKCLHAGILPESPPPGDSMAFQISVEPSRQVFEADADEPILEAALRHGLMVPYGCRDGVCGACRSKVLSGQVDHGKIPPVGLGPAERESGYALLCCARAQSDVVIETRELRSSGDIPVKTLPARVEKMTLATPDVMLLELKLPASERLQFLAGQYIDILLKDGRRRAFSLANAPHDDARLQLHIRRIPGGHFTEHVFTAMKERDLLRINGPHGSFFLREESARPILLVAGGTGFAPIKAIVEHAIAEGMQRPMTIYRGARRRPDLYLNALADGWMREHAAIRYIPVLSEPTADDGWAGRTGLVHLAAMHDNPDFSAHQVYVCGAPAMVAAARRDFVGQCGLPEHEFFADAFEFAGDAKASKVLSNSAD